ncbi:MAG TPA: WecB/TagA/CpsF family glycosyltransferase, partial [Devosia sp.]|nr:WecB/TagA/CpsF family glycosyltransferase [Devosia sp.]
VRRRPDRAMLLVRAAIGLPMPASNAAVSPPGKQGQDLKAVYDLLMGIRIIATKAEETELIEELVQPSQTTTLAFLNQHGINLALSNASFRGDLAQSSVLVRDGVGSEVALLLVGRQSGLNINGTDFIPHLLQAAMRKNLSVAVIGTNEPWLSRAGEKLRQMGVRLVASVDGFREVADYPAIVAEADPDIVVLGMGMPRQEAVASLLAERADRPRLIISGGAILDFHAERFMRAPLWFQKSRLEWLWRLIHEPKRLGPRYIAGGFAFAGTLARLFLLRRGSEARGGGESQP